MLHACQDPLLTRRQGQRVNTFSFAEQLRSGLTYKYKWSIRRPQAQTLQQPFHAKDRKISTNSPSRVSFACAHVRVLLLSCTAASGLFMVGLWVTRLQPVPRVDKGFLMALLPVALFHVVGHVSACLSFSQMAVSFAHIVKSAEPVSVLGCSATG